LNLPTALVLASGRGERFLSSGGAVHKLDAVLANKPVLQHVLDAVRASGLPWHLERADHPGMGDCIAAAVAATLSSNGWLMVLGDLPLLQPTTLIAVKRALQDHPVVVPRHRGQRGHPVGFAVACRDDLLALRGDVGAAQIVRAWGAFELDVDDIGCVTDVDTVQTLALAEAMLMARHADP
jgi:molybdenum cofactor cytidylyltransferase